MKLKLYFFIFLIIPLQLIPQEINNQLKVGYVGSPPFVFHSSTPEGIVIDVWKEVALNSDLNYTLMHYSSVNDAINAMGTDSLDVVIGSITINRKRAEKVSFTQPFFETEMGLLAPEIEITIWEKLSPFFSTTFLYAIIGLLFILTIVGFLVWLTERKESLEEYKNKPIQGIGLGVWLSIVTMTTVGYGDYAPKSVAGRVVLGAWMIISLIMATSFVAGIASTLTASNGAKKTISSINDINDKTIATPSVDRVVNTIRTNGGTAKVVNNIEEGIKDLENNDVNALIYDLIPLEYMFNKMEKNKYRLSKKNMFKQNYGFIVPIDSPLLRDLNLQILKLKESNEINYIVEDWINRADR